LLGRQPIAQKPAERGDAGARTDQDDVLLGIGTGAEGLPRRVDPGADLRTCPDIGQMVRRHALEQAVTGSGRRIQHADHQRDVVWRQQ